MTLRQRAAGRAAFAASLIETAVYIASHPELDEILEKAGPIQLTFPVSSKAEADEVIEAYGARPLWRNGAYMAELHLGAPDEDERRLLSRLVPGLPADFPGDEADSPAFELHFAPPITDPGTV